MRLHLALHGLSGSIQQGLRRAVVRFPLVCFWAVTATVAAWFVIARMDEAERWSPILMAALIGLPTALAATLFAERADGVRRWIALALGLVLPVAYYLTLPVTFAVDTPSYHGIRFLALAVAAHLAVAVAPYLQHGEQNGFWQFNRSLFLRIGAALFFSVVIATGISAALVAVSLLFDVTWPDHTYSRLWIVTLGIFNTAYFLAGVPVLYPELDREATYPRGLLVLSQYILLPLAAIYFVILYAYIGRIVIEWAWPHGWVSSLIIGFSTFGVLTMLLLFPRLEASTRPWIHRATSLFPAFLLPLVVVLLLAVWQRVAPYGITEPRYMGFLLGAWLGGIALYLLATRGRGIKAIPLTLGVLLVLASFGPWSMFAVSAESQRSRLLEQLRAAGVSEGQAEPIAIPAEQLFELDSITRYLADGHGEDALPEIVRETSSSDEPDDRSRRRLASLVILEAGTETRRFQHVQLESTENLSIGGYEHLTVLSWPRAAAPVTARIRPDGAAITFDPIEATLTVELSSGEIGVMGLAPLLDRYPEGRNSAPADEMTFDLFEDDDLVRIVLTHLEGMQEPAQSLRITRLEGFALTRSTARQIGR
jgi:hypothetical protein